MSDSESSPADDVFDVDRIRRLVQLMEDHDLREIDLRQAEQQIRLRRGADVTYATAPLPTPLPGPTPVPTAPPAVLTPAPNGSTPPLVEEDPNIVQIKSPMVGTFYLRANPNAEPYVRVGDMVDTETTVCIIEAMKVFNEIPAEVRGKVVAILVDDEEPVDFGRPLFKIDTSGG